MGFHRKVLWLVVAVVATSLVVSCDVEQGGGAPEPPPPPSPEEIRQAARDVWQSAQSPKQNESEKQYTQRVQSELQQFRSKYGGTDTGRQEMISMTKKLLDGMRRWVDQGKWEWAEISYKFVTALDPTNAEAARAIKKIRVELNKPKVKLTMFTYFQDEEKLYVGFEVTPKGGEAETVNVQVGDEFFGYKLKRVIGNNQGAVLEYLPTRSTKTYMLEK